MIRTSSLFFVQLIFWVVLLPTHICAADWINPGEETLSISGGVFLPSFDTNVQVDSSLGSGTDINLEDDLGLTNNETIFWGDMSWRFARKHRLTAAYFGLKRDASAVANKDLVIGDETYPAGASVSTEFKLQIIPFIYSFSFLNEEKYEFGASLGLHWFTIDLNVSGSASADDEDIQNSVSADGNAPLPLLGLFFDYHFTPKWSADDTT